MSRLISLSLAAVLGWATAGRADEPFLKALGDLRGGEFYSKALAVSPDGRVVVGMSVSERGPEAFRLAVYLDREMTGLGSLGGEPFQSSANGVSRDGVMIVGDSRSRNGPEAFILRSYGARMEGLGDLPGGGFNSGAFGVAADGSTVVGFGDSRTPQGGYGIEAFRWTRLGGMVGLGALSGYPCARYESIAYGVSADGSVIVGRSYNRTQNTEAFRWTLHGGMLGLGDLPGGLTYSTAHDVSDNGKVIVGLSYSSSGGEAFRWEHDVMVGLGALPDGGRGSAAYGVSGDGNVIVGEGWSDDGESAFIWTLDHGMRNLQDLMRDKYGLDLPRWRLEISEDVSDDGRTIVGHGTNADGYREGWIAHLPEKE